MNERKKLWNEAVLERRQKEKYELERRKALEKMESERNALELEQRIHKRHAKSEKQLQVLKQKVRFFNHIRHILFDSVELTCIGK